MAEINKNQIINILKNIKLTKNYSDNYKHAIKSQGRDPDFDNLAIFKIFILMQLTSIRTIKGIWKYLNSNDDIRLACGVSRLPDRSTLSRRLRKLNIQDWLNS